jgi:uncharacterized protein (DUF486 family)
MAAAKIKLNFPSFSLSLTGIWNISVLEYCLEMSSSSSSSLAHTLLSIDNLCRVNKLITLGKI